MKYIILFYELTSGISRAIDRKRSACESYTDLKKKTNASKPSININIIINIIEHPSNQGGKFSKRLL